MKRISLTLKENEFQKLVEFLKSLSSVQNFKTKEINEFPSMTEKEIIDRVAIADKEIKHGKTISHDEFVKEFKKW